MDQAVYLTPINTINDAWRIKRIENMKEKSRDLDNK